MAKTSTTKSVVEDVAVEDSVVKTEETTTEKVNEENKKNTKKAIKVEPLEDSDEIEVISLIPNVSYKDSKTLDTYKWEEAGHIEYMTFETLKNMWRNNKGYFKNMWLKPKDDRVINKFGLTKTFEKFEYLMDASNYTRDNIKDVCSAISSTPNSLKMSIYNKIKNMVISGEIVDVFVIRTLERHLKVDLIEFLK